MIDGWRNATLGVVCSLRNGRAYKKSELLESGRYPVLRVGNFFTNRHWYYSDLELDNTKYCDRGDLLYAWSASFGPRIWDGTKSIFHYHIWRVDHDQSEVTKRFLFYWFEWDAASIKKDQGAGTTMMHVSMKSMNARAILYPSLTEQERIVAILDEAFAAIATATANAEKNLANARELFDSHLNQVFDEKDETWQESAFVDLCKRVTVGHVGSMKSHYCPEGVSFLRSQNIRPFRVDIANLRFIDLEFESTLKKSRLYPGDVAIVRTGYPGTAAVIPDWLGEANCSDLVIVRPGPNIDPHFVAAFFNSPYGRKMVSGKLVGAAQKHFNITAAKQVRFPYPPLIEQRRLIQRIHSVAEEVERLAKLYQDKSFALSNLKQSLLHKAFTGELTADSKVTDRSLSEAGL